MILVSGGLWTLNDRSYLCGEGVRQTVRADILSWGLVAPKSALLCVLGRCERHVGKFEWRTMKNKGETPHQLVIKGNPKNILDLEA